MAFFLIPKQIYAFLARLIHSKTNVSMDYSTKIRTWYREHARDLPWRHTTHPYPIWLSEVILQQTRVAQGEPYFHRFLDAFPTIHNLANAEEDQVMKLWEGLGYYSRAKNLHKGAKYISTHGFPQSYEDWLKVPGVGPYTAAAVSSFCFEEERAVVDGNVNRVIARLFHIDIPVNSTKGQKIISEKAAQLIAHQPPSEHNQAIMELGALICTPTSPKCEECPAQDNCLARSLNAVNKLPLKEKKTKIKTEKLNYVAIYTPEGIFAQKRNDTSIWKNLYELIPHASSQLVLEENMRVSQTVYKITHLLSHKKLEIQIESIEWDTSSILPWNEFTLIPWSKLSEIAFPKPIRHWLDNNLLPLQPNVKD